MIGACIIIFFISSVGITESYRIRRQGFLDLGARCVNTKGQTGVCLNIRECPTLVKLLVTQRQQAEVVDFLRASVCGYQGSDPQVCCPFDSGVSTSSETSKPKSNLGTTETPIRTTTSAPFEGGKLPEECGKVQAQHTRVVGGANASLGAWPWMAAIGYQAVKAEKGPVFLCGGTLISDRHILTAAHCLAGKRVPVSVRLGDLNLYESNDGASPVDIRVAKSMVHESYSPVTFTNDIGIIELQRPVKYTDHIKPICLPISTEVRTKNYVGRRPFIAGWGSTSFGGPSSAVLLDLQLPVVPEAECKRAFEPFKTATIDKRVLCAGYLRGGKDACRGDSGGPLMDFNAKDSRYYQIGVVSFGYKCAEQGFPGVYTRVTEFVDWVVNKIEHRKR